MLALGLALGFSAGSLAVSLMTLALWVRQDATPPKRKRRSNAR